MPSATADMTAAMRRGGDASRAPSHFSEPYDPTQHPGRRPASRRRTRTGYSGELEKRSWNCVLKETIREFTADQCMDAAALTYYGVLSMFPALIAAFSLLGVFGQSNKAADALKGPIEQLAHSPGAGFALISGIVVRLGLCRRLQSGDESDL
jgi:membrane protein